MIPNFSEIGLTQAKSSASYAEWEANVRTATGRSLDQMLWETPEKIGVKPLYTASDLDGIDHLDTMPGMRPFQRGPYPTMYVTKPWTIRQYAGFSTAEA